MNEYQKLYKKRNESLSKNKECVIEYIQKLLDADGTDEELDQMLEFIEENTIDPEVSDLIFWDRRQLSATQIYDIAMSYRIIEL